MSRKNVRIVQLNRLYEERTRSDGSTSCIYINYEIAIRYWLMIHTNNNNTIPCDYRFKFKVAAISCFASFVFFCLYLMGLIVTESMVIRTILDKVSFLLFGLVGNNKFLLFEMSALLAVSFHTVNTGRYRFHEQGGYAILSYKNLRSGSCNRPNFIKEDDVLDIEGKMIPQYLKAFCFRLENVKSELQRYKFTDAGITTAALVSIVTVCMNQPNPILFIIAILTGLLILFFINNIVTQERFAKMKDQAIYEMIIQDLMNIQLEQKDSK